MDAPREIELKLTCTGPDLAALGAHPLLQGASSEPKLLTATYFDTADGALRAAGLTLRVRRTGENFVQTVKAGAGAAGLFDRAEWETEVAGEAPDPDAFADTPVADLLAASGAPALIPQFRTVVTRSVRPVTYGDSRIAATLDAGHVEAEGVNAPLCELELELESGSAADLFGLAQALAETVPLRLGVLSKSARGFALRKADGPRPSKAGAVALPQDATGGEAFRLIALACLRHLRLNEDVLLATRDPEALHQIRVALRRLRTAFSLFKPMLAHDARAGALSDEIKRVTEPFGRARNLDVFVETTLAAEIAHRPDEPGLPPLRARLEAERTRAHDAVGAILAAPEWRGLILDLAAWIETGPWRAGAARLRDGPARDVAGAVLERLRRRIAKRGRHIDRLDPEARHRVRIAGKKLRYGAEFFAGLYPGKRARRRHKAFGAALSDLQDHLGGLNDLATAHAVMAGLADDADAPGGHALFAAGLTAADADAHADDLLAKAAEAHGALRDVKPFWR
ncbi:CHAD domain-containing protein [uncultured Methylobacterium sp.]|uniref:CYTH and CHAD domain-containing protein n=1 Tax=uncultured Methylobacterium sp. TaxID=157278 RepID=UPI0035C94A60